MARRLMAMANAARSCRSSLGTVSLIAVLILFRPPLAYAEDISCRSVGEYAEHNHNLNSIDDINEILRKFWGAQLTNKDEAWIERSLLPWFAQCQAVYATAHNSLAFQNLPPGTPDSARQTKISQESYDEGMSGTFFDLQDTIKTFIALHKEAAARQEAETREEVASRASSLPKCESDLAIGAYKASIEGSPSGKLGLRVEFLKDAKEVSFNSDKQIRTCRATAYTNAGKHSTIYTIENAENGQFYLEAKMNDDSQEDYYARPRTNTLEDDERMKRDFCLEFGGDFCR